MTSHPGNAEKYALKNVVPLGKTPLTGKHICYLGSSVTFGACSCEESFVEFIAARNGNTYVKEAVSGTTLVDNGSSSYISRMKTIDRSAKFDLFVCQLSTNDTRFGLERLGEVVEAIETIIEYASATWSCPIVFYTGSYFANEMYARMVSELKALTPKYPFLHVADLYTDEAFNAISHEARTLYMNDPVHPTRAGYREWWTPKLEAELSSIL